MGLGEEQGGGSRPPGSGAEAAGWTDQEVMLETVNTDFSFDLKAWGLNGGQKRRKDYKKFDFVSFFRMGKTWEWGCHEGSIS